MPQINNFSNPILAKVEKTARRFLSEGNAVLIAVSGGPDSVALLHILAYIAPRLSLKLGIAHLNHLLRGKASDKDEQFVSDLAKSLNLPVYISREDVSAYQKAHKISLEEAGRKVRYEFFEKIRQENGFDKIALGHHADDNAELVLMNLIRGSGALGLSGIPPERDGIIVRPLIHLTRSEITNFLKQYDLAYVTDESNSDPQFLRNRIRHELIPILRSYNPSISRNLNRLSDILKCEEDWIEGMITPMFEDCVIEQQEHCIVFSVMKFNALHVAARRRLIRKAIVMLKGNIRRIAFEHLEAILSLSEKNSGSKNLHLPDQICIEKENNRLIFKEEDLPLRTRRYDQTISYHYEISCPSEMFIPEISARLEFSYQNTEEIGDIYHIEQTLAFFDMNVIQFPLIVRNFRPGDRFHPLGMTGTQKLKTYFINSKVSKTERLQCPLVLCKGEIIWVAGYRPGQFGKITPKTQKVLKAELFSGGSIR